MLDYKQLLNDKQYDAVTTASPYVRVIAGAGSGKTRVLTYRISYLINELGVEPWKVLAITFTNKVAKEMKTRVLKLCPQIEKNLYIQTYHAFCTRFLRSEINVLGYSTNFSIIDDEDQEKIMKQIFSDEGKKKNDPMIKKALNYISSHKSHGEYPEDINCNNEFFEGAKDCFRYYEEYEKKLNNMLCLDFDDLLLKTLIILQNHPEIQVKWQRKIDYILIDEFQDTNDIQYKLVQLLMKPTCQLFVVGDPDQTIYTWRGANQDIILDIEKRYNMSTIILNENYRSTSNILKVANELISHNKKRVPKDLFTEKESGEEVKTTSCFRADDEANWVLSEIQKLKAGNDDFLYSDVAILYRSAYLTLPFEKALTRKRIPYKMFGGLRFYQRKEIKDVLSYFRLVVNKQDDVAFTRIINVPKRNIGETSVDQIRKEAEQKHESIYEFIENWNEEESEVRKKVITDLRSLISKIDDTREKLSKNLEAYSGVLKDFITDIGYYTYLGQDEETDEDRIDNVNSLFEDIISFIKENPESKFEEYLQNVALLSAQDDMENGDYVALMTVHTAKGLEFPYVFVVGLNEGVFPSERSILESPIMGLEEERRLCYVAFTRAEKRLYLSCNQEYSYTMQAPKIVSRFFAEAGLKFERRSYNDLHSSQQSNVYRPTNKPYTTNIPKKEPTYSHNIGGPTIQPVTVSNSVTWKVGDTAKHTVFGEGIVTHVDGNIIQINFDSVGIKTMVANHPTLSKVNKGGFDA